VGSGMQRNSAGLKCRDFGAGQKCRVMTMLGNWPGIFWPNDGGQNVMLAVTITLRFCGSYSVMAVLINCLNQRPHFLKCRFLSYQTLWSGYIFCSEASSSRQLTSPFSCHRSTGTHMENPPFHMLAVNSSREYFEQISRHFFHLS